ncbi:MAG: FAD:protein FMN transferase [Terriglobia bacterium]
MNRIRTIPFPTNFQIRGKSFGIVALTIFLGWNQSLIRTAGSEQTNQGHAGKASFRSVTSEDFMDGPGNSIPPHSIGSAPRTEPNQSSTQGQPPWNVRIHYVMGTLLEIRLPGDESTSRKLFSTLFSLSHRHDQIFSTFISNSPVSRFNAEVANDPLIVPQELIDLSRYAKQLSEETDGAFDITVMPLVQLWQQAALKRHWPSLAEIARAKELTGVQGLEINAEGLTLSKRTQGLQLDFGGIAKGYCVDKMAECIKQNGLKDGFINFGESSIFALGKTEQGSSWDIAVRDPQHPGQTALSLKLSNMAIGSSAAYEKQGRIAGRTVGHIIDPRSGLPAPTEIAVTVVAPSAALADALSTALIVLPVDRGMKVLKQFPGAEAVVFYRTPDGKWHREYSPGFYHYL